MRRGTGLSGLSRLSGLFGLSGAMKKRDEQGWPISFIWSVELISLLEPEKPNKPEQPEKPDEPDRPDEQQRQAQPRSQYNRGSGSTLTLETTTMIVTAEANGRNQRQAFVADGLVAWAAGLLVLLSPPLWFLLGLSPFS